VIVDTPQTPVHPGSGVGVAAGGVAVAGVAVAIGGVAVTGVAVAPGGVAVAGVAVAPGGDAVAGVAVGGVAVPGVAVTVEGVGVGPARALTAPPIAIASIMNIDTTRNLILCSQSIVPLSDLKRRV
jgi:hypothetical protein